MKIIISNEITITEPSDSIKRWCEKNLVYNNPDYIKKKIMGFWLGNTPKKLQMYKVIGGKYVLPFGVIHRIWHLIKKSDYIVDFKVNKIYPRSQIKLYDYQEEAVKAMLKAKNGVLISKAGSGKSQMMLEIICRLGYKALWINNKKDLLNQALDRAKSNIVNCTFGTITEGKVNIGDITFSTIQTLAKIDLTSLKDEFSVIVYDEFQNCTGVPTKLTQSYKVLSQLAARYKFGCTACAHRSDGLMQAGLDLIGDIAYEVPEEAIADKIVRASVKVVHTEFEPVKSVGADGLIESFSTLITEICSNEARNKLILEVIKENSTRHIIVLSDRLNQLKKLQESLGYGLMIDGGMNSPKGKKQRREAIEKMRTGEERILFATYSLAKEGLDIPILDTLIMASPKKDKSVIIQSVGRIERKYDGKETPIVFDFVDDYSTYYTSLANMFVQRRRIYQNNKNEII